MYPVLVACLIRIESFIDLQQEMVVVTECPRRDGERDAVGYDFLVVNS